MDERITITDLAKAVGVTPRTIMRWDGAGRIKKPKRDWRGWRFYYKKDIEEIKEFYESIYEYDGFERSVISTVKKIVVFVTLTGLLSTCILCGPLYAASNNFAKTKDSRDTKGVGESSQTVDIVLDELPVIEVPIQPIAEAVKYTLGPDDVISIEVRRHPEFSGKYIINSEGKIEYKYLGDIIVDGLTKFELKERLEQILSDFVIDPDVDIQILQYLSKVFYVVGEVSKPGKFYMRGNAINVREALVQAGLPTHYAATRKCRLITPNKTGKQNYVYINVYELMYGGDLKENHPMKPGDVLYIPATVMAKIIRVITPVTNATAQAAGAAAKGAALSGL